MSGRNADPSGRDAILARVRRASRHIVAPPPPYAPPALPSDWEAFAAVLREVGGEPRGPVRRADLAGEVRTLLSEWAAGGRIVAEPQAAQLLADGGIELRADGIEVADDDAEPHSFQDVAVAILPGALGVAENAAVAVPGALAPHRALHFLCQRLVLLLPAERIVPDMHAAIADLAAQAPRAHHLTWISGPSKTADIEQALVYGAHGPLSLAVVAYRG